MTPVEPTGVVEATVWVTQIVPPKTHAVWVLGGWTATGFDVVVRYATLFKKTKPEDGPMVGSSFLIGTRDELRMLLFTRYWPLLEAAKAPDRAVKSFREVVKVCSASLYRNTFPSSMAASVSRPSAEGVNAVLYGQGPAVEAQLPKIPRLGSVVARRRRISAESIRIAVPTPEAWS